MVDFPQCWKCGATLEAVPLPLSRYAECPACGVELHVCRMCRHYDPAVARACREPVADEVHEKTRANFCGYLEPRADAYRPGDAPGAARARAALDALFGSAPAGAEEASGDDPRADAEALFRPGADDRE